MKLYLEMNLFYMSFSHYQLHWFLNLYSGKFKINEYVGRNDNIIVELLYSDVEKRTFPGPIFTNMV